jgi:pyruvate dehydrogenase E2 component (dihydrolipoamide acetyltransferase)
MAATMTAAAQVPHITSHREVDATQLFAWRTQTLATHPDDAAIYTFTPFFALCVVGALSRVPELNAHFAPESEELTQFSSIGLGIATATPGGLVVPVVHQAERLGLQGLAREIDRLKSVGRDGQLRPADMGAGTFTVTNFGANGGWFGTPLLRLPEIGIAGVGRAALRPWVVDGEVVPRPILPISVSVDHRVVDGELSARFTNQLVALLSNPLELLSQDPPWS